MKLLEKIKDGSAILLRRKKTRLPSQIQIEPTNRCNLKCTMCAREYFTKDTNIGDMNLENFKALLEQIKKHTHRICLSGWGEPFLNSNLIEMIKYCKEYNIYTQTFSNATLFCKELAERVIRSQLDFISCSIDAIQPSIYRRIRSQDVKLCLNGLKNIITLKKKYNSNLQIRIGATITDLNFKQIPNIIKRGARIGITQIDFKTASGFGNNFETTKLSININKTIKKSINLAESLKISSNLHSFSTELELISNKKGKYMIGLPCYLTWIEPFISWYGEIRPCCEFYDSFVSWGNVFEEPFKKVWNNRKAIMFRNSLIKGTPPHKICYFCNAYRINLLYCQKVSEFTKYLPLVKLFNNNRALA